MDPVEGGLSKAQDWRSGWVLCTLTLKETDSQKKKKTLKETEWPRLDVSCKRH
jgi:hypothetical protein